MLKCAFWTRASSGPTSPSLAVPPELVEDPRTIVFHAPVREPHDVDAVNRGFGVTPAIGLERGATLMEPAPVGLEHELPFRNEAVDHGT